MSLRAVNLNLLPVLRTLLKQANVSRAADELCLTQPAVSNALNRLRTLLNDPLLVQVGRGMRLTPRAQRLLPLLDDVCNGIEYLLHEGPFVPLETTRTFVVCTPDYMSLLLAPALIDTLRATAPNVAVRFIDVQGDFADQLAAGSLDVALLAWDDTLASGLCALRGYTDHMVGVVAKGHPLARRPPTDRATLKKYPQIALRPAFQQSVVAQRDAALLGPGQGAVHFGTSQFMVLPLVAARTDCVAVVPRALATCLGALAPIVAFDLPDADSRIDIALLWHPLQDADPAHRWFRGVLDSLMRSHFAMAPPKRRPATRRRAAV